MENKISLWKTVAKSSGLNYLSGEVTIDGVKYRVSLYDNEKTKDSQPDMTGKVEVATK